MPKFERCDSDVPEMADGILNRYETHADLIEAGVKVDYVFAFADRDEDTNERLGPALTHGGYPCLGICRKIGPKDRALGRGDAEISLDGDWWTLHTDAEREALLDHELHHIEIAKTSEGTMRRDDDGRPKIKLRKHDFDFGWFKVIAARHGAFSQECIQAKSIVDSTGQLLFPGFETIGTPRELVGKIDKVLKKSGATMTLRTGGKSVTVTSEEAKDMIVAHAAKAFAV